MPERALCVAVLITEVDGSSMARCFTHYDHLEKAGWVEMLGRWQVFDADVAVFHRYWKSDTLELIKSLQRHGVRVAVDVDDHIFELDPSNPAWHEYHQPNFRASAKKVLKTADGLFVSTADLSEKYAHYSDHITVIPNALNLALWPAEMERAPRGTITLGFAGGASHLGDLDLLRGVLGPLLAQYPRLRLVFLGAIPPWLGSELGDNGQRRTKHIPLVPVTDYPSLLARERFDIALAPLAATAFNAARSNLKFLEYSLAGAATVASAFGPFADPRLPLARVASGGRLAAWLAALRPLIEDAAVRTVLAATARDYVMEHHAVERSAARAFEALSRLRPDLGRMPFERTPAPFPVTRETTVVMPVHDAPELTRDAIAAVLPELGKSKRLFLIDDGSRLPETVHLLADTVRRNEFVRVFARPEACAFVAAANFGMREAQADDVILLNSDTRVSPGFIDRLKATAYSHPRYGIVTAVSNRGSIASAPDLADSAYGFAFASATALRTFDSLPPVLSTDTCQRPRRSLPARPPCARVCRPGCWSPSR